MTGPPQLSSSTRKPSGGGGTVTFSPGTYYFCDINLPNQNAVTFQATASATAANPVYHLRRLPVRRRRVPSGTGNFAAGKNTLTVAGASGVAGSMLVYIYGTPGCTTTYAPTSSATNSGSYTDVPDIFAPNSALNAKNNVSMTGDFVIGP